MTTYLDHIVDAHRAAAVDDTRDVEQLLDQARRCSPARPFASALLAEADAGQMAVIAEVKRRSPSKGAIDETLDPAALASDYARGGAAAVSVLTDVDYFGGSPADLAAVRAAVSLPVLRKDFTIDERDVLDARLMGADCVLLIVTALDDAELRDFHALANDVGLEVLVEVHDEAEVERAMLAGATLVGVNQRDLMTFQVDTARAVRVGTSLPNGVVRVAESGINNASDVAPLRDAGYHAVLVGESLVRSGDPASAVTALQLRTDDRQQP